MIALILAAALAGHVGIVDGDTFRLNGERVRLWGVNAPEARTAAGPAATKALDALTRGKTVTCELPPSGQDHDRYGRLVRQCFADGKDLAAEMVRSGNAVDWPRYSRGYYAGGGR